MARADFGERHGIEVSSTVILIEITYMEIPLSVLVLRLFGNLRKDSLELHTLFEAAGNDTEERQHVLDAVDELTQAGMLEAIGGDFFVLTEKAKEEIAKS